MTHYSLQSKAKFLFAELMFLMKFREKHKILQYIVV